MARAQHKTQESSVCLGVAVLMISALVAANAAEPREETGFGSNPGNLRMFSYVPANQELAAPLIVVLHGCKHVCSPRPAAVRPLPDRGCGQNCVFTASGVVVT
jgi:poly(3-hydroxybutyrate) depolymerase